ncbi:hypothetical protein L6164_027252 [Bauhinia variegata]|uniref:Uncharacterized protein n=1 Tax=Bauhinia variegata TaxID=167791 RepID=A0ACB9LTG8_BAUVA|nr:hypothetical protein L6164_027252 [Bauhinia variegata]
MAGAGNAAYHDIQSLFSSSERDYLVKIESLKRKKLGLYSSASWCGPCQLFTPNLVEVSKEVYPNSDFEVIFLSADDDDEAFNGYFAKMLWLAVPFSDSDTCNRLDKLFKVMGIPHLVILHENGRVVTESGVQVIREYEVEGYPFTSERIGELKEQEEEARRNQSLRTLLVSRSRDFVISADSNKVPISELEVKIMDDEEEAFKQGLKSRPWFSLPIKDKSFEKLARYFELSSLPTVDIIGPDGKTLHSNVAEAIEDHGIIAYPFTPEKFAELAEIEKAKEEAQTLESILVSGDLDFVIGKDGVKIPRVRFSEEEHPPVLLSPLVWSMPCFPAKTY